MKSVILLLVLVFCNYNSYTYGEKPLMRLTKTLHLDYDNISIAGQYEFLLRRNDSGNVTVYDFWDNAADSITDNNQLDDYGEFGSIGGGSGCPSHSVCNDSSGITNDDNDDTSADEEIALNSIAKQTIEFTVGSCLYIHSNKTKKILGASKLVKKNKIFVTTNDQFAFDKWDIKNIDNNVYTIQVSKLPYYWGINTNCNESNLEDQIQLISSDLVQSNLEIIVNVNEEEGNFFTMSVCKQCVYIDDDNFIKLSQDCTKKDSTFFLRKSDTPEEICSELQKVFIRSPNYYYTSIENGSTGVKFQPQMDAKTTWNIVNYDEYSVVRLAEDPRYHWEADSCYRNGKIILSNSSELTVKNKFNILSSHVPDNPIIVASLIMVCQRFVIINTNNDSLITQSHTYNKKFLYFSYDTENVDCLETVRNVYIVSNQTGEYVGLSPKSKSDKPEEYQLVQADYKQLWNIHFCPAHKMISVFNGTLNLYWYDWYEKGDGEILLWHGGPYNKFEFDIDNPGKITFQDRYVYILRGQVRTTAKNETNFDDIFVFQRT